MASTDTSNKKTKQNAYSPISKQVVRQRVETLLKQYFSQTLATVPDITNLVMALIQKESSFNPASVGPPYSLSHLKKILSFSAIGSKYSNGTATDKDNIKRSAAAFGLMQVTGYYIVKGAGANGSCELERMRPDIAAALVVQPGVNVSTVLNGDVNIDKQILCGLAVLEDKYKNVAPGLVKKGVYSDRMMAAFGAYLGLGASDSLGSTPQNYARSIMYGASYLAANSGKGYDGRPLIAGGGEAVQNNGNTTAGPTITAASGQNLGPPGC